MKEGTFLLVMGDQNISPGIRILVPLSTKNPPQVENYKGHKIIRKAGIEHDSSGTVVICASKEVDQKALVLVSTLQRKSGSQHTNHGVALGFSPDGLAHKALVMATGALRTHHTWCDKLFVLEVGYSITMTSTDRVKKTLTYSTSGMSVVEI